MDTPRKTQKQVAQRYAGNLQYYKLFAPFRRVRLLLAVGVMIVGGVIAVIGMEIGRSIPQFEWWHSSGGISQAHAGFAQDCAKCHDPSVRINPFKTAGAIAAIDQSCLRCHTQHTFHEPNVVVDHSCVACHHEHLGTGPMKPVTDLNCRSCHSDAAIMAASAAKGAQLPPHAFITPSIDKLVYFQQPRPPAGRTQVITAFDTNHPDFEIQREHLTDPNTLKFNHEKHLTSKTIPMVNGKKLDCAYCHQVDSHGAYMQSISFARNCQACHALQVDPTLPGFQIPHPTGPDSNSVRNFLLTLPTQYATYATYATQKLGMTGDAQVRAFVGQQMSNIRERVRHGDDLVQDVFFADAKQVNFKSPAATGTPARALFPGCAYCHEVNTVAGQPVVTPPVTPDRWLVHSKFSHSSHSTISCAQCHNQVFTSSKTSDINLPEKASCVTCHSAKGRVVSTCVTCHGYHNTEPTAGTEMVNASPLRDMMLGGK